MRKAVRFDRRIGERIDWMFWRCSPKEMIYTEACCRENKVGLFLFEMRSKKILCNCFLDIFVQIDQYIGGVKS